MGKGKSPKGASGTGAMTCVEDETPRTSGSAVGPDATPDDIRAYLEDHWLGMVQISDQIVASWPDTEVHISREALEAVLAVRAGMPVEEWAELNKHRSWLDLYMEAKENRRFDAALSWSNRSMDLGSTVDYSQKFDPADLENMSDDVKALYAKTSDGAKSGRMEDYSRADLRKLLGFLERDCKHLADNDLRGMVLDAGLVPKWKGSPSHADLALAFASRYGARYYQRNTFREAMRTPYSRLLSRTGFRALDDGRLSEREIRERLMSINPVAARNLTNFESRGERSQLYSYAESVLPSIHRPDSDRNGFDSYGVIEPQKQQTSMELKFSGQFQSFVDDFPEATAKLTRVHEGSGGHRGVAGLYKPATGEVYVSKSFAKTLDDARRGKEVRPQSLEDGVSTITHELFHSMEGRDPGNRRAGMRNPRTVEHALDEGVTESLARIYTDRMAEKLGVWDIAQNGSLRDQRAGAGSYQNEVHAVHALMAAATGELSRNKLQSDAYDQPEALSADAQSFMRRLHLQHGVNGRLDALTEAIQQRSGKSPEEARDIVRQTLASSKRPELNWRTEMVTKADGTRHQEFKQPQSVSVRLLEVLDGLITD